MPSKKYFSLDIYTAEPGLYELLQGLLYKQYPLMESKAEWL